MECVQLFDKGLPEKKIVWYYSMKTALRYTGLNQAGKV